MNYPREDKCEYCGEHIGWIAHPLGEMFALGVCDICRHKAEAGQSSEEQSEGKARHGQARRSKGNAPQ
jgi:hypothetical protein